TSPASMILSSSLDLVPAYGWTLQTLQEGARSLGYSASAAGMFPRGGVELAEYFVRRTTGEVRAEMEEDRNLSGLGTTAKVKEGVRRRLLRLRPFVDRWPEALGLMAQPQNAPTALQNLGELVDEIWYVAGDRSVDMNWYSKRVLLAGVYTSTELFMTQDKSEDFTQTDKFLDRRLQDVAFVGKSVAEVNKMATFGLQSAFGVLASRGINIKNPFM
ncbi:Ubiquinone biosynthesis protein coq9, mitochondrial, partial [Irineochytrium annulatum]